MISHDENCVHHDQKVRKVGCPNEVSIRLVRDKVTTTGNTKRNERHLVQDDVKSWDYAVASMSLEVQ
jgi:hypothetical protein